MTADPNQTVSDPFQGRQSMVEAACAGLKCQQGAMKGLSMSTSLLGKSIELGGESLLIGKEALSSGS